MRKGKVNRKEKKENLASKLVLAVGLLAMWLLIWGTISQGGSLQQKVLFATGAPILGIVAYINKQEIFSLLQAVATLGAFLAFFPSFPETAKYALTVGAGVLGVGYLFAKGHFKTDRFGFIGAFGLFLIALGMVTDPLKYALWFDVFLGFGGLAVALYSGISFLRGVRIAAIWLVLNIIFSISPLADLMKQLKVI